jgi:hypothetical protein
MDTIPVMRTILAASLLIVLCLCASSFGYDPDPDGSIRRASANQQCRFSDRRRFSWGSWDS